MSEDFDGDYAGIALQAMEAGLDEVAAYLDKQARAIRLACRENKSLREENNRLHEKNDELGVYLKEQRARLKPDKEAISEKAIHLALEVLDAANIFVP